MINPALTPAAEATAAIPGTVEHARRDVLESVLEPVLKAMGYELVHLEWGQSGRQSKLQVFVDKSDGGIGLEDCARLSPVLGNALDAAEVLDAQDGAHGGALVRLLQGAYVLEVSSPGLERPLSRRSHFARFIGRSCKLRVFSPLTPGDSQRNFHGRIEAIDLDPDQPDDDRSGTVSLRDPDDGTVHHIPLSRVRRAHLVYEG
ncbi:MAG: ribosome maturation factor RimP [Deltaproteobacteria bacterium]|nr:ribosome maturation factor RimP [Deltaproteobacteria bacterium]